jgi:Ser/Thr protein kinase RdoA (MazF antagonist)
LRTDLEFHWPGSTHVPPDARPSPDATVAAATRSAAALDEALARFLDSPAARTADPEARAEYERPLRAAIERIIQLEDALHATRAELADATSALETQRVHIDALNTQLARPRRRLKRPRGR